VTGGRSCSPRTWIAVTDWRAVALDDARIETIAHGLRTPLTVLTGLTRQLVARDAHLSRADRRQAHLDVAVESAALHEAIENLLILMRPDRRPRLEPLEPAVALGRAISAHRWRFPGRPVRELLPKRIPMIRADEHELPYAIGNLLSNAARFSAPTAPIVAAVTVATESVQIEILDEGDGIPEAEREAVFDAFYRGPNAPPCGLGLGLTVARILCEAQGGWVEIVSPAGGKGTRARIGVPRDVETVAGP
jgi:K+-sensing histidine kinase KdpD